MLSLLHSPTLTSIHDYWTNHSLTRQIFVGKVMSLLFNMLSRLVIAFLPRSKRLLISWLQSPSAVILEPPKIKSLTVFIKAFSLLEFFGTLQSDRYTSALLLFPFASLLTLSIYMYLALSTRLSQHLSHDIVIIPSLFLLCP